MCQISLFYAFALWRYYEMGAKICPPAADGWHGGPAAAGLTKDAQDTSINVISQVLWNPFPSLAFTHYVRSNEVVCYIIRIYTCLPVFKRARGKLCSHLRPPRCGHISASVGTPPAASQPYCRRSADVACCSRWLLVLTTPARAGYSSATNTAAARS